MGGWYGGRGGISMSSVVVVVVWQRELGVADILVSWGFGFPRLVI